MQGKFNDVGQAIFVKLEPQINGFLDKLKDFADWVQTHQEQIGAFLSGIGNVILWIADAFQKFNKDTGGTAGVVLSIGAALTALGVVLNALKSALGLVLSATGALACQAA